MKLNTNSNAYIIIYSAVLVVIVAFLLAFVYQALKPMQDANVALDVKKQILYSLNICDLDGAEAEAKYAEVVKEEAEKDGQKYYLCEIDGEDILVRLGCRDQGLSGVAGEVHRQEGLCRWHSGCGPLYCEEGGGPHDSGRCRDGCHADF